MFSEDQIVEFLKLVVLLGGVYGSRRVHFKETVLSQCLEEVEVGMREVEVEECLLYIIL